MTAAIFYLTMFLTHFYIPFSWQNRARLERNKEYNEFLKQQAQGKGRRLPGKRDGDVPDNKVSPDEL